jgi:hypothetical protein
VPRLRLDPTMTKFKSGSLLVSSLLCPWLSVLLLLSTNTIVIDAKRSHFRNLQQSLDCVDSDTGALSPGFAVENGVCMKADSSVFFYDILQGPVSANGLQPGAPTDIQLLFGSLGRPVETAMDPINFGLQIPGAGGRLILDLGPEFVYDAAENQQPTPDSLVGLAMAVDNNLFGNVCPYTAESLQGGIACANWNAEFGTSNQQILIIPQDDGGLTGQRAAETGVKLATIHPIINTSSGLYRNARGECSAPSGVFCVSDTDCSSEGTCIEQTLTASITATVIDGSGNIVHKATQSVEFMQQVEFMQHARFSIFATNSGLANDMEVNESVDFQRALPGERCENFGKPNDLFSSGLTYAPRFIIFAPKSSDEGYPHAGVPNLGFQIFDDDKGAIFSNGVEIGTFQTVNEFAFAEGKLVTPSSDVDIMISNSPAGVGGSIFALPLRISYIEGFPARYAVKVTLLGGAEAVSRVVIDGPPTQAPSFLLSAEPSQAPTQAPSFLPSAEPSKAPTV